MATTWAHLDLRGIPTAMQEASLRAGAADWALTGTAAQQSVKRTKCVLDLRALLLSTGAAAYAAAGKPLGVMDLTTVKQLADWDAFVAAPDTATALAMWEPITWSPDRASQQAAVATILRGWQLVAERNARQRGKANLDLPYVYGYRTEGASEPFPLAGSVVTPTAGNPIAIAAILAGSAALAYLGSVAIDAYERNLAREKDTQRLVQLTAAANSTLVGHAAADKAAGKVTPLSGAEQQVLDALAVQIKNYAPTAPPPPAPPKDVASSVLDRLLLPAALLAGGYLLVKGSSK